MSVTSVAVCVASHTSRVSTMYLLYLFVFLLLIVFTPHCKMLLLISDRKLLDMTPFFMSFSPPFEDDTSRAWWVFFFTAAGFVHGTVDRLGVYALHHYSCRVKNLDDIHRMVYAIAHRLQVKGHRNVDGPRRFISCKTAVRRFLHIIS
jgi:hypothetical protein